MCLTLRSLFLIALILMLGVTFQSVGLAAILFQDDFEDDTMGKEPKKWKFDPDAEVNNIGKIDKDPVDPTNQVFTGYGGYLADKGAIYKDFVLEYDWMFMKDDQNNSLGFRVVDQKKAHYQLSRRSGAQDWKIYQFNGAWNEIVSKAWPTDVETWYSVQLICEGPLFTVKAKKKDDPTLFKDIGKPLLKIKDDTHEKGFISTSYWGPIDNIIIAEHENDILAVQTSNKLSTIWGKLKTRQ